MAEPAKKFLICALCEEKMERPLMRPLPHSVKQCVLLLSGTLAFCFGSVENLRSLYLGGTRKHICHRHFSELGAALVHELSVHGITLRSEASDSGWFRLYVLAEEVPDEIMSHLFECERKITDLDASLLKRDVSIFLYDVLERYFEKGHWKYISMDGFQGARSLVPERREKTANLCKRPRLEQDCSSESHISFKITCEPGRSTNSSPIFKSSGSTYELLEDKELPETEPTLMSKYFVVDMEQLLQLFKCCPQCGCKLFEGEIHIGATGTAPVVRYFCRSCSPRGIPFQWEGQMSSRNALLGRSSLQL